MSGLLEKDFRLILQRKQALIIFLAIALVFGFTMEGTFIMGYLPFLAIILAVGTISYDEFENGYTFLMTLPIDTKTYVAEKFIFCILFGIIGWIFAIIIFFVAQIIHGNSFSLLEDIIMNVSFLFVFSVILAILIPVQLKFGLEKSRTVMMLIAGVIMAGVFLLSNVSPNILKNFVVFLDNSNQFMILTIFGCISLFSIVISYFISCKIMNNKEF